MRFVLTGRCPGLERADLIDRLHRFGHIVASSYAGHVDVLVASDEAVEKNTAKLREARSRNVDVWPYSRLLTVLQTQANNDGAMPDTAIPPRTRTVAPPPSPSVPFGQRVGRLPRLGETVRVRPSLPERQTLPGGAAIPVDPNAAQVRLLAPGTRALGAVGMVSKEWGDTSIWELDGVDDLEFEYVFSCRNRLGVEIFWRKTDEETYQFFVADIADRGGQTTHTGFSELKAALSQRMAEWRRINEAPAPAPFVARAVKRSL